MADMTNEAAIAAYLEGAGLSQNVAEVAAKELGRWATPPTRAAKDVLAERRRQIEREGWTPTHDDEHNDGSLAAAAACYATDMPTRTKRDDAEVSGGRGDCPVWRVVSFKVPKLWPDSWHAEWWKPKDRRSNLVRAGALILAEIERLDRTSSKEPQ